METKLYQGSRLFRNQPSYRVFNKDIEQADDTLFTFLNDVDAEILKQEQEEPSKLFTSYTFTFRRCDPRTQELMERTLYDHSTQQLPYEFPNPQDRYSVLSPAQQAACLRLLLAWQNGSNENEADFIVWRVTNGKRCKEQQLVQTHIYKYANTQRDRLFAPMKPLVLHYAKWFERRLQHLLGTLPNSSYSTHSGLPQLAQCKALNEEAASVKDVQLLCRRGQVRLWPEVRLQPQELSTLRLRLARYAYAGVTDAPASHLVAAELEKQLLETDEDVFVLPLDALLMILTAGAYVDLPTEMLLSIRQMPDSAYKCIQFQEPLPARNCGWHTNNRLLTQAYAACAPAQWLAFSSDGAVRLSDEVSASAQDDTVQPAYKLYPIDEDAPPILQSKANNALVSWRLCAENASSEAEPALLMYSSLPIAAARDALAEQVLGCHLIKLENKPECGCEIMTKYELLSAWLQLKLLQSEVGHCSRIALRDLAPLLEERLTLDSLEEQLHEYYHISMPQQLSQLREFLKLLRSVAPGEYLLRYTDKYKDKFLLCRPTVDSTPKSFKLHDLLASGTLPNDVNFLTQSNNYLPISPKLCSRLHEQLQLLPCSFPARILTEEQRVKKKAAIEKKKKFAAKPTPVQRTRKKMPKAKKKRGNASRQRKKTAAKAQREEDEKMEKFMCL